MSQTSSLYKYSSATQGFILWSCWAFYINYKVSFSNGITAGLVQGSFSFIATLVVIAALTRIFNFLNHPYLKLIIPTVIVVTVLTVLSVLAHTLAKTPEIFKTVAPNLFVAAAFCSFTTYKLANQKAH